MSQALDPAVKAIISDPEFEITTTLTYSAGLVPNPNVPSLPAPVSYCYFLQYSIDRMRDAATDLSWTAVVENLNQENRLQTLAKEIESYMISTHGELATNQEKAFIVRLGFKEDASLSFRSEERRFSNELRYPLSLPPLSAVVPGDDLEEVHKRPIYLTPSATKPSLFTKHKTSHRAEYNTL